MHFFQTDNLTDQNTNIKTKKNVIFSFVFFFKLSLNDIFIHLKKLKTLILVIKMYKQSLLTTAKPRRYHFISS